VVWDQAELDERVKFIHESITGDALIEEFIDGREIYVGVFGNKRLTVLPPWELFFEKTRRARGDRDGAREAQPRLPGEARDHRGRGGLEPAVRAKLIAVAKRIYRACRWMATRDWTSGCAPTGRRSSSRPIPTRDREQGGVRAVGAQGRDQVSSVDRDDPLARDQARNDVTAAPPGCGAALTVSGATVT
jgi:hypothetical protein